MLDTPGFKMYWGDILRSLRHSNNLTQQEIADMLHITRQAYSNIECGRSHPSPEALAILSDLYSVDLYEFVLKSMPGEYVAEQNFFKSMIKAKKKKAEEKKKSKTNSKSRKKFLRIVKPENNVEDLPIT